MSYKTFEDMKHDIPEGATHYRNEDDWNHFAWVKYEDCDMLCVMPTSRLFIHWHVRELDDVKPIPQTETPEEKEAFDSMVNNSELPNDSGWNGEGLPPAGVECEFLCEGFWGDSDYHWCRFLGFLSDKSYAIEFHHPTSPSKVTCQCFDPQCTSFRKSETPQQREERERLEAAYNLYLAGNEHCGFNSAKSFDEFKNDDFQNEFWLAIVDKTGYRKAK